MKVRFDEIPADGLRLEIKDEAWFPDHDLSRSGGVVASVFLRRDNDRVLMEGSLATSVLLQCDRCLEFFESSLVDDFEVDFELADESMIESVADEHLIPTTEMDTVFLSEPAIDIYEVLSQQVFLALPEKLLCSDGCLGLCNRCGANLNMDSCQCEAAVAASPFSVLAGLKKKK
ncbi:MAG: DUF177 domain-containing protein [Desulfobulbaceae bacterium]|nr:DUF177 domain-containing protein [Desulfobulbaceae bacterium]